MRGDKVNEPRHPAPDPPLQSLGTTGRDARGLRVGGSVEPCLRELDMHQIDDDHSEEEEEKGRQERHEPPEGERARCTAAPRPPGLLPTKMNAVRAAATPNKNREKRESPISNAV